MSNCLKVARSCSGVGPGGSLSSVDANSASHRLASGVARGSGLESVSVRERGGVQGIPLVGVCGGRELLF
jgi:hypothetical protein